MVKVYTSAHCVNCEMTKRYLETNGVEFETRSAQTPEAQELFRKLKVMSLPVVVSNDELVCAGFNIKKLKELVSSLNK